MSKANELTNKLRLLTKKISAVNPTPKFPLEVRIDITARYVHNNPDFDSIHFTLQYDLVKRIHKQKLSDGRIVDLCEYCMTNLDDDLRGLIIDCFSTAFAYDGVAKIEYTRLLRLTAYRKITIVDVSVKYVFEKEYVFNNKVWTTKT